MKIVVENVAKWRSGLAEGATALCCERVRGSKCTLAINHFPFSPLPMGSKVDLPRL